MYTAGYLLISALLFIYEVAIRKRISDVMYQSLKQNSQEKYYLLFMLFIMLSMIPMEILGFFVGVYRRINSRKK
jgi:undecaprenyl pyrophosphate phosphatase UppP